MSVLNPHPKEDLIRYLDGALEESDKRTVEQHLTTCQECQSYLSFVKDFHHGLAGLSEEEFTSQEPCPDSWTLLSYEAGDVDEKTARHLRAHLLFCDKCQEEFYLLRRSRQVSWRERIGRLREFAIDLGKTYGPGAVLGSVRILAESPAFALRGGVAEVSKTLDVPVGENAYRVEVTLTSKGSLSCGIAGHATTRQVPLEILVLAETGEELFASKTDDRGSANFDLPTILAPHDLCVISLTLERDENHVLFMVPGTFTPPS